MKPTPRLSRLRRVITGGWLLRAFVIPVVLGTGVFAGASVQQVLACSAGPDYDPVAEADIIVEGRIVAWTPRHDLRDPASKGAGLERFIPIEVTLQVESVFKGEPREQLTFFDQASLTELPASPAQTTEHSWVGSGGACGAFDADPLGARVILGLHEVETGELRSHRLTAFFIGASVDGERYRQALDRLDALQPIPVPTSTIAPESPPTIDAAGRTAINDGAPGDQVENSSRAQRGGVSRTTAVIVGGSITLLLASITGTVFAFRRSGP